MKNKNFLFVLISFISFFFNSEIKAIGFKKRSPVEKINIQRGYIDLVFVTSPEPESKKILLYINTGLKFLPIDFRRIENFKILHSFFQKNHSSGGFEILKELVCLNYESYSKKQVEQVEIQNIFQAIDENNLIAILYFHSHVNKLKKDNYTPLYYAIKQKATIDVIALLLLLGAKVNVKTKKLSPLFFITLGMKRLYLRTTDKDFEFNKYVNTVIAFLHVCGLSLSINDQAKASIFNLKIPQKK